MAAPVGTAPAAIELRGITKRFGSNLANDRVDLTVGAGTIHGIVGENGAGKSTLMNILYGFYEADQGEIRIDGRLARIRTPADAIAHGIGMVHQHFMLVGTFTVLENLLLGAEGGPLLRRGAARARQEIETLEREFGLAVDLDAPVQDLPVGIQQRVEILKALFRGARVLVLDEPTGVLTPQEADDLFRILAGLRAEGRTIVLITHKLREILAITDEVSVMRRGRMVAHRHTGETSREELAELMVGRKVLLRVAKGPARVGSPVLVVNHLRVCDDRGVERVKDVSFTVREGEIVGLAGVAGNGQSELMEAIGGIRDHAAGAILLRGQPVRDPRRARADGLGHVPEDRLKVALVGSFRATENAILGYQTLPRYGRGFFLERASILATTRRWLDKYDVRPRAPRLEAVAFSGGNQQKLVLAREMEHDPDLLLVGQPTRGVDIGAIEFIHRRLIEIRDAGKAVLLVSVELDEILALSDRILVICGGRITGELAGEEADERTVGLLMAGGSLEEAA